MTRKEKNNYIKLGIILIGTVLLTIVSANIYRNYENNKSNKSYISKYVSSLQCNELSNAMTEISNKFLYISYTGNNNIYDFEKKLKKVIKEYDLEEKFIFVDCSNEVDENNHVKSLKELISVGDNDLSLPAIVYFKDSNPVDYIDSRDGLINIGEFSKVLDRNEIEASK